MLSGLYCTVLALLTLGQLVAVHAAVLTGLKYVAVIVFMVIGVGLIMARVDKLQAPDRLIRAGFYKDLSLDCWSLSGI